MTRQGNSGILWLWATFGKLVNMRNGGTPPQERKKMILETKFNIGDQVYSSYGEQVSGPLTIGKVQAEVTDSPGIDGETLFDNYKAQKKTENSYMCVETGIGTGARYAEDRIFKTREEAENKRKEVIKCQR